MARAMPEATNTVAVATANASKTFRIPFPPVYGLDGYVTATTTIFEELLTQVDIRGIDLEHPIEAHDLAHDLIQVLLRGGRTGQLRHPFSDVANLQARAV